MRMLHGTGHTHQREQHKCKVSLSELTLLCGNLLSAGTCSLRPVYTLGPQTTKLASVPLFPVRLLHLKHQLAKPPIRSS